MKNKGLLIGLVVAFSLCVVCSVAGFFMLRAGIGAATETLGRQYPEPRQFVALIRENKIDEAYAMCSKAMRDTVPVDTFHNSRSYWVRAFEGIDFSKPSSFRVVASTGGNRTTLVFSSADEKKTATFVLVEEAGASKSWSVQASEPPKAMQ